MAMWLTAAKHGLIIAWLVARNTIYLCIEWKIHISDQSEWSYRFVSSISIIYGNTITHQTTFSPNTLIIALTHSRSHYLILPHPLNHTLLKTPHPPLTHPTILSFLPSLAQSFRHCFINLVTHSITSSLNHSSIYSSARSIIPSPTHSATHPITPPLILHPSIHSAIHFFTDSTSHSWVWKGRNALLGFPVCVYFWLECSPFGVTGMLCEVFLIIPPPPPPRTTKLLGVYWFHSICPSVRPSRVRPAFHVSSVAPTVLVGSISYLYILSNNFRRCVACNVSCKISKFEFLAIFLNL